MKKLLVVTMSVAIFAVMFFNLNINASSSNENDIRIENINALACYEVEEGGSSYGDCCWPYSETCWVIDLYNTLPGVWGI